MKFFFETVIVTFVFFLSFDESLSFDADGNEITINTGKTYVAFVPDDNWDELEIK